jgi:cardiolipin synthase
LSESEVKPWGSLNWPNRISLLRLLLVAPFIMLVLNQGTWFHARHFALLIFVVLGLSDLLDGVLARRMGQRTRLGAILDPLADKALIICSVVLLSLPGSAADGLRISNWVVVVIVGKDLWVILGFIVIYLVTDRFRVHPTGPGKAAAFAQLVMVGLFLIGPDLNALHPELGTRLARGGSWIVAVLSLIAGIGYTRLGLSFLVEEQKPMDPEGENSHSQDEHD